ncbi:ABC transporter [Thiohalocapsa halophila]|uniref:ABC transporter n=1 Tax=Thiohalocapsa halophila TaxID=69359 RepID=A0ABS1CMC4_9GAMM|nr:ABC transporter ATP-binding protein [Thiohalocapsa halophila]MBK1633077.1 ABC transporter [Thiohalocapsa halophila]
MSANVSVDYITHTFKGQPAPTLKDIALTIHPGEQVALIGRSGCGKSTLLHMLAGLLMPSEGCVHIRGHMVTRPSAKWNMMFQKPSLYPWMTVRRNAELGLLFAGHRDPARIDSLLELVGLADKAEANVQSLSGGQQQRVALARSLATSPELLLLDEPFSALDAFTRAALQDEVSRIARQAGLTLVIVTHDIDEAVAMADRVLIMAANPGRIAGEMAVELPAPRERASAEYSRAREQLMTTFDGLVGDGRSTAPQPAVATEEAQREAA